MHLPSWRGMLKDLLTSFVILALLLSTNSFFVPKAATTGTWDQTDWSGGSSQTNWSDATKFSSSTQIDTTTAGEFALAQQGGGGANTWARVYSTPSSEIYSMQQTSDGGYIAAGAAAVNVQDFWVVKLDSSGAITWQKTYGGSAQDQAYSVQQTSDGGYIVAGNTQSFGAGSSDIWILKLDPSGNVVWQKTYGGTGWDSTESIRQTSDGGYFVAAYTSSYGDTTNGDVWALKLDSSGNVVWQKTYGGTGYDGAYSGQQTSDGGYIIAAENDSTDPNGDAWILKLDSSGNVVWQKTYGGSAYDYMYSIQQTSDGGYITAGYTESFGAGGSDAWILKLDSSGNVVWQKTYGGTGGDTANFVQQTSDGGYVVAGYYDVSGNPSYSWVFKLDSNGNITWQELYAVSSNNAANVVQQTSDGNYVVAGQSGSNAFVFKVSSLGTIDSAPCSGVNQSASSITPASTSVTPVDTTVTPVDSTTTPVVSSVTPANVAIEAGLVCPALQQNDWSGGPGQVTWSDATKFNTSSQVNYSSAGSLKLAQDISNSTTWLHQYTEDYGVTINSAEQTSDGGYIVAGQVSNTPPGVFEDSWWRSLLGISSVNAAVVGVDVWVAKIDSNGVLVWQKTYGGSGSEFASVIKQTSDGGYVVGGQTNSYGDTTNGDIWILKLDSSGNVTWQQTYGGTGGDYLNSLQQTSDGGYIIGGSTTSFGMTSYDAAWIFKLDSSGGVVWQNTYQATTSGSYNEIYSIKQTSDGGYIAAGDTASGGAAYADFWVLKLDSTGAVTWQNTYGGASNDTAYSVQQTSDGGYIVAGYSNSFGSTDAWVLKLSSTGTVTWQNTYGSASLADYAFAVQQTSDGGYALAGFTFGGGVGLWVFKLDSSGNITWQEVYNGAGTNIAGLSGKYSIQQTSDGGYLVASSSSYLLRINSSGAIDAPCSSMSSYSAVSSSSSATVAATTTTVTASTLSSTTSTATPQSAAATDTLVCTLTYYSSGTLTSSTYNSTSPNTWGPVTLTDTLPAGTSVTVDVSTDGGTTWQNNVGPTQTFGPSTSVTYRLNLSTAITSQTPTISSVNIGAVPYSAAGYYSSGTLTSSIYDTGQCYTIWGPVHYTASVPMNTDAVIDVSTDGGTTWQAVKNFLTQTFGPAQTLQYRVNLSTSDTSATPVFNDISIPYQVFTGASCGGGQASPSLCWSQGNWSGGSGQTVWGDSTKYLSGSNVTGGAYSIQLSSALPSTSPSPSVSATSVSPSVLEWARSYGAVGSNGYIQAAKTTSDGGYIVAGYRNVSGQAGSDNAWLMKLDGSGNLVWQKLISGSQNEWFNSVAITPDGGYVAAGETNSFGNGKADAFVVKFDSSGNVQWQKTYGGANDDWANTIQVTPDQQYILTGGTSSVLTGPNNNPWILKISASGNPIWQRTYGTGTGAPSAITSLHFTSDGNMLTTGYVTASGNAYGWLMKLDSLGNVLWQKLPNTVYGPALLYDAREMSNGDILAVGSAIVTSTGYSAAFILSVGPDGQYNSNSDTYYEQGTTFYSLATSINGTYVASGVSNNSGNYGAVAVGIGYNTASRLASILWNNNIISVQLNNYFNSPVAPSAPLVVLPNGDYLVVAQNPNNLIANEGASAELVKVANPLPSGQSVVFDGIIDPSHCSSTPETPPNQHWISASPALGPLSVLNNSSVTPFSSIAYAVLSNSNVDMQAVCSGGSVSSSPVPSASSAVYANSGVLTSSTYSDNNPGTYWGPLAYTGSIPSGAGVAFQVSTDKGQTWQNVTDYTSQSFGPSDNITYRVVLNSDGSTTPVINTIGFNCSTAGAVYVSPSPGVSVTPSPTLAASSSPSPTVSSSPVLSPTPSFSPVPTLTFTPSPTLTVPPPPPSLSLPTPTPSINPSIAPSINPSGTPTVSGGTGGQGGSGSGGGAGGGTTGGGSGSSGGAGAGGQGGEAANTSTSTLSSFISSISDGIAHAVTVTAQFARTAGGTIAAGSVSSIALASSAATSGLGVLFGGEASSVSTSIFKLYQNILLFIPAYRKRKKPWGIVFDQDSGLPIPGATVRLVSMSDHHQIDRAVTGSDGRFLLLADHLLLGRVPSTLLEVEKDGFAMPKHPTSLPGYEPYLNQPLIPGQLPQGIHYAVALEKNIAPRLTLSRAWVVLRSTADKAALPISSASAAWSLFTFTLARTTPNLVILFIAIALFVLQLYLAFATKPTYGTAKDVSSNAPLSFAQIRLFDVARQAIVATTITNREGAYSFLITPGTYQVFASLSGYKPYLSQVLSLSKEGVMTQNIQMEKE